MSQIKWSLKDVANIMHISNMVGNNEKRIFRGVEKLWADYGFSDGQSQKISLT